MSYPELDPRAAHSRLSEFRIIDVREPHEYEGPLGQIDGADLVPLGTVAAQAVKLVGPRPLLIVCRSGVRSGKACELLQQTGIDDVTNLAGGMIAWNRAALPIRRKELKSLDELVKSLTAWLAQVSGKAIEEAMSEIDRLLEEAGASRGALTVQATNQALEALAAKLEAAGPPPDLDLTLSAYRGDLAVL